MGRHAQSTDPVAAPPEGAGVLSADGGAPPTGDDPGGLTSAEARRRLRGRSDEQSTSTSRSYRSIVRANLFTVFNLILVVFGTITLIYGDWRDALFLSLLLVNTGIGIGQEVRAKRALDRLALLVAPQATVVRDGTAGTVPATRVVAGDRIVLQAGDQVVADGGVVEARGMLVDESLLTGEAEPVPKQAGDELRSGSFVVEGSGAELATAVGDGSYAGRLLGEARSFRHPRSPLERAINTLLFILAGLVVVLGVLLGYALWHRHVPISDAVSTSTAGVVSLVPEGLVVLVSLTYAVASIRMARRGVLSQQLNAIESLASADVVCLDKTGTLTESALRVAALIAGQDGGTEEARQAALARELARYAGSSSIHNATLDAIARARVVREALGEGERGALESGEDETGAGQRNELARPADTGAEAGTPRALPSEPVLAEVPFSSRRKWSAVRFADETLVLGAPERFELGGLAAPAAEQQRGGRRVVALARSRATLDVQPSDGAGPPADTEVLGLVVLAERLRPRIRQTVAFFREQGVELKVLSGDNPDTVAAIAKDVGIPIGKVLEGRELPRDRGALREVALDATVIGRVSPADKRDVIEELAGAGRYVAMVGDGVNDVPALKASRLAIAQGSGTEMAKSVADLVLVDGDFAAVPELVAQGRRALRNLQRVARLYVTKSAFAAFLILTIGISGTAYPLLPRHFTLAAAITIGIPTFFLALAPSSGAWRPDHFVRAVARFAVPAGTITGTGVVASYVFALRVLDESVMTARTIATTVLTAVGLYLVVAIEGGSLRRRSLVATMCLVLAGVYVAVWLLPATRHFFALAEPTVEIVLTAAGGALVSIVSLYASGFPDRPLVRAQGVDTGGGVPNGEGGAELPDGEGGEGRPGGAGNESGEGSEGGER